MLTFVGWFVLAILAAFTALCIVMAVDMEAGRRAVHVVAGVVVNIVFFPATVKRLCYFAKIRVYSAVFFFLMGFF